MEKIDYVRQQLDKRAGQWSAIAKQSGVARRTLYLVADPQHLPNLTTVNKLFDYFKANKPIKKKKTTGAQA